MNRSYYYDIVQKKERFTTRTFQKWQQGGILNRWGAVFTSKGGGIWIPDYLISTRTLAELPPKPLADETEESQ